MTKKQDLPELIDLQSSHVTQHSSGASKTPWKVEKNITNEALFQLPSHLTETEVFAIMRAAKKFELIAFNQGIKFGKRKQMEIYKPLLDEFNMKLKLAREENERLADVLDRLTRKEV